MAFLSLGGSPKIDRDVKDAAWETAFVVNAILGNTRIFNLENITASRASEKITALIEKAPATQVGKYLEKTLPDSFWVALADELKIPEVATGKEEYVRRLIFERLDSKYGIRVKDYDSETNLLVTRYFEALDAYELDHALGRMTGYTDRKLNEFYGTMLKSMGQYEPHKLQFLLQYGLMLVSEQLGKRTLLGSRRIYNTNSDRNKYETSFDGTNPDGSEKYEIDFFLDFLKKKAKELEQHGDEEAARTVLLVPRIFNQVRVLDKLMNNNKSRSNFKLRAEIQGESRVLSFVMTFGTYMQRVVLQFSVPTTLQRDDAASLFVHPSAWARDFKKAYEQALLGNEFVSRFIRETMDEGVRAEGSCSSLAHVMREDELPTGLIDISRFQSPH
ncbi:MAG: hypothetical protein AB7F43_13320 [Bacteriovoracia bacterium]